MVINNVTELESLFQNSALLSQALTHRSWLNEHDAPGHNERLEFLGDAVLEYVVSSSLYNQFPDKEEGFLTTLRANIVNTVNLSKFALKIKLGQSLKLSKGEENGNGRENESLMANTVEAVIGALYLDRGLESAQEFIADNLLQDIPEKLQEPLKDPKSRLQEMVQAEGLPTPHYKVISETGPDHEKQFKIEVTVGDTTLAVGEGKSKSRAQQAAAELALVNFEAKK